MWHLVSVNDQEIVLQWFACVTSIIRHTAGDRSSRKMNSERYLEEKKKRQKYVWKERNEEKNINKRTFKKQVDFFF